MPHEKGQTGPVGSMAGSAPLPGTCWVHRNGLEYEVVALANDPPLFGYKLAVVYRGKNGKWWTRPADDWHRSFLALPNAAVSEPEDSAKK